MAEKKQEQRIDPASMWSLLDWALRVARERLARKDVAPAPADKEDLPALNGRQQTVK